MKVRDCYENVTKSVDIVAVDTSIDDIIDLISRDTASRSVYVVDDREELVGIISIKEVMNILGAKYLKKRDVTVIHEILAQTAADIMRDPEFVTLDDDLEEALKIAVTHDFRDLPVVEDGKIVGDLDCFEIVKGVKEDHKRRHKKQE